LLLVYLQNTAYQLQFCNSAYTSGLLLPDTENSAMHRILKNSTLKNQNKTILK